MNLTGEIKDKLNAWKPIKHEFDQNGECSCVTKEKQDG